MREHIMQEAPIPSNLTLEVPEMDSDWMALVLCKSETINAEDGVLSRIQTNMVRSMGPLGLLWQQLDSFRKEWRGTSDLSDVLPLIEVCPSDRSGFSYCDVPASHGPFGPSGWWSKEGC